MKEIDNTLLIELRKICDSVPALSCELYCPIQKYCQVKAGAVYSDEEYEELKEIITNEKQ